jgi:argininosuccinate lyase
VHLNIEKRLTALVGDAGKRLHTGRSRNDQVATDIRLWLRDEIDEIDGLLRDFQRRCSTWPKPRRHPMPGFTHLQVAQPVTFGHHLLAYFEMFARDRERFADCRRASTACRWAPPRWPAPATRSTASSSPRARLRRRLRELARRRQRPRLRHRVLRRRALVMTHLSRLSEELILWMSPRVGFIDLADRFCTGSSIMPQKKNPDVPELARGKTGRVNGT